MLSSLLCCFILVPITSILRPPPLQPSLTALSQTSASPLSIKCVWNSVVVIRLTALGAHTISPGEDYLSVHFTRNISRNKKGKWKRKNIEFDYDFD